MENTTKTGSNGKGSKVRPYNIDKYSNNFDEIFNKKDEKIGIKEVLQLGVSILEKLKNIPESP